MLDSARQGDVVIVWKLDRLGRSLLQLIETVSILHDRGVQLRSLTGSLVDTTTPSGKLVFGIFALMAEFERDLLRQRTIAGLLAARKRGRIGGRPRRLTDKDIKKARALLISGDYSRSEIAEDLGVSLHTLWRASSGHGQNDRHSP
jgi:DNA invertase Pin-like site-specific DNA recombinase